MSCSSPSIAVFLDIVKDKNDNQEQLIKNHVNDLLESGYVPDFDIDESDPKNMFPSDITSDIIKNLHKSPDEMRTEMDERRQKWWNLHLTLNATNKMFNAMNEIKDDFENNPEFETRCNMAGISYIWKYMNCEEYKKNSNNTKAKKRYSDERKNKAKLFFFEMFMHFTEKTRKKIEKETERTEKERQAELNKTNKEGEDDVEGEEDEPENDEEFVNVNKDGSDEANNKE